MFQCDSETYSTLVLLYVLDLTVEKVQGTRLTSLVEFWRQIRNG